MYRARFQPMAKQDLSQWEKVWHMLRLLSLTETFIRQIKNGARSLVEIIAMIRYSDISVSKISFDISPVNSLATGKCTSNNIIFKYGLIIEHDCITTTYTGLCFKVVINDMSTFGQARAWYRQVNTPLSEPVITMFCATYDVTIRENDIYQTWLLVL